MKKSGLVLLLLLSMILPSTSQQAAFSFLLEEVDFPEFPALQSFVIGNYEEKWVLIGGRTDGLHRRQPFAAFDPQYNNTNIHVVDISSKQIWSATLNSLPESLTEQLQSSNMEYVQKDQTLYITGGYGYSSSSDEWITYPYLTAVNLQTLTEAVVNGNNVSDAFRSITDERVRVTGGYLGLIDDTFVLAGGQNFEGRYNPHGPSMGPGFFQQYTNAIKKFNIQDDGNSLSITNYEEITDSANLHRRDYNLVPQVFPNQTRGFTMFSGVFQYDQDLPWLNTVDIFSEGYQVNNDFSQLLNQYHTAHTALYNEQKNEMHTVFFGGISRYYLNANGVIIDDPEVPFVKTISLVTRADDGSMQEFHLGDMPGYLGASAEFVPAQNLPLLENNVIQLDQLSNEQFIGYIVGGIESTLPNVLFLNGDDLSIASGKVYKVTLQQQPTGTLEITGKQYFGLKIFPNPGQNQLTINFSVPVNDTVLLTISDASGQTLIQEKRSVEFGEYELYFDVSDWTPGMYYVNLRNDRYGARTEFVKGQ